MDTLASGADAPIRLAVLHDSGARPLAHALIAWSAHHTAAGLTLDAADAVQADGDEAVTAARALIGDRCLGLYIGSKGSDDTALRINRLWQQHAHPGVFLLRGDRGDELLATRHPGQSPCLQCWHTQLDQFPWLHDAAKAQGEGSPDSPERIAQLGNALSDWLRTAPLESAWHCLRLDGGAPRKLRVLRDPICPHCSAWSRRPTQAFYVQPTEAA